MKMNSNANKGFDDVWINSIKISNPKINVAHKIKLICLETNFFIEP
jgi:hypothetical protein